MGAGFRLGPASFGSHRGAFCPECRLCRPPLPDMRGDQLAYIPAALMTASLGHPLLGLARSRILKTGEALPWGRIQNIPGIHCSLDHRAAGTAPAPALLVCFRLPGGFAAEFVDRDTRLLTGPMRVLVTASTGEDG